MARRGVEPQHVEEGRRDRQRGAVGEGGGLEVAAAELGGDQAGRERDEGHHHQEADVDEEEEPVDVPDLREDPVMVDPDDADGQETDGVGGVAGPDVQEPAAQVAGAGPDVEDEEGGGDGEDAVAERLEPRGGHRRRHACPVGRPPARRLRHDPTGQSPPARQALELVLAAVHEVEIGTHDEIHHGPRDQDLTGARLGLHPLREMHRDARHVVSAPLDLARVHADADVDAELAEGFADRDRGLHGVGGAVEGRDTPSPVRLTRCPPKRASCRSMARSCCSRRAVQVRSPRAVACSVEPTMSENRTVARRRSLGSIRRVR